MKADEGKRGKIFVAMAESENRRLLTEMLLQAYEIFLPEGGVLDWEAFDLCIADKGMAQKLFEQLLEHRSAEAPFLPVLFLARTGPDRHDLPIELYDEFFSAPVDKQKLADTVARMVLKKQKARRLFAALADYRETAGDLAQEKLLREQFVSALTHDLRTPLTAVRIAAQLLARKAKGQPEFERLVHRIVLNVDRTDGMIRNLLDANRINAGEGMTLNKQDGDLKQTIESLVADMDLVHKGRIHFDTHLSNAEGFWDLEAIRRVLENLIGNAIKYGNSDSPIRVNLRGSAESYQIDVHNFGNPISPSDQRSLFTQFKRADTSLGKPKGWGIGLTLVRGITEAHGGLVAVVSNSEEGTTFSVILPTSRIH